MVEQFSDVKDAQSSPLVLVTGSTAIDQTGLYAGSFETYETQYPVKALNASFQLQDIQTSFGGCALNIAFGLRLLGVNPLPLSSAGRNFRDQYEPHLHRHGIDTRYIAIDDATEHSACCMMLNDTAGNQIIAFYPGVQSPKRLLPSQLPEIGQIELAIIGPENAQVMLLQARDLHAAGIKMIFDPGQVITDFDQAEIHELLSLCQYLILNNYEYEVLKTIGRLSHDELVASISQLIVTQSAKGVDIFRGESRFHIPAVKNVEVIDVTGCGDAFRAGYVYGLLHNLGPAECGQFGCVMAAMNLATPNTQNYDTTADELRMLSERYYT